MNVKLIKTRPSVGHGSDNAQSSRPVPANRQPRLYAVVVNGVVITKYADGFPYADAASIPKEWVTISRMEWDKVMPGWMYDGTGRTFNPPPETDLVLTPDERILQLEATVAGLVKRIVELESAPDRVR